MRIHRLVIGSGRDGDRQRFRNLKNVVVDFDESHWVTVVLGANGTGKSNVLEALAIIFRELVSSKSPEIDFSFELEYSIGIGESRRRICIDHDPDRQSRERFRIAVERTPLSGFGRTDGAADSVALAAFLRDPDNLPRYIFSYYSGQGTRLEEVFQPYLEWYDSQLRGGKDPGNKRLFYATRVHSQFVLLAFLLSPDDFIGQLLKDHMGLDPRGGIDSVLFVLRQPHWRAAPDGDDRFWGAKGIVGSFLSRLYDVALAPITAARRVPTSTGGTRKLEFQYLFLSDMSRLRDLVGEQSPADFFRDLESTYVSHLIEEVRIRVRLKGRDEAVTFRELSEGEQQLLTVLGLLRFTAGGESLILLDEPDTHLNPRWSIDYLRYLEATIKSVDQAVETSHVVMTTHNPLAIAELEREQVQVLRNGEGTEMTASMPDHDPRGMGFSGIVTSDMFGLDTALDLHTVRLLDEQRALSLQREPLGDGQAARLMAVNQELESYGFRLSVRDPDFEAYLRHKYESPGPSSTAGTGDRGLESGPRVRAIVERAAKRVTSTEGSSDADDNPAGSD